MSLLADRRTGGTSPSEVITTTLNGVTFRAGRRTAAHLAWTDDRAREHGGQLRIIQPCYNTGVAASAGTHDKDGVVDVEVEGMGWRDAERFMRECGWACWYRFPPTFGSHLHAVSLGCPGPVGIYVPAQVDDYYRHALGLKGQHDSGDDPTWHPADINRTVFDYPAWEDPMPYTEDELTALIRAAVKAELADAGETVRVKDGSSNKRLSAVLTEIRKAVTK